MSHLCHALRCKVEVPPAMFMCRKHWYMVPRQMRALVWLHYVPGQEVTKDPTPEYLDVVHEAIKYVSELELTT